VIVGIGIDIVESARLRADHIAPGFLKRILHSDEYAYILQSGADQASSAAARFAAKEAFGKALGTGIRGFSLKDVKISHDRDGRPVIEMEEHVRELCRSRGGKYVHLSISHERHYASAVVIIEG